MKKYILFLALIAGCSGPIDTSPALPESQSIAKFGSMSRLERFYDYKFGVVCYKIVGGSALSCTAVTLAK